jgi:hypothetical protein
MSLFPRDQDLNADVAFAAASNPDVYSETSIHRFRRGSEKETVDPGAIV